MENKNKKEKQTKVSCNSQLYSEYQKIYIIRVKKIHMSKVYNYKGKSHVAMSHGRQRACGTNMYFM